MSMAQTSGDKPFELSMLLYDKRYRSLTIQIFALICLMLGATWLVNNAIVNLENIGKTFGFSFMQEPANYDISQRLIEYNSQSPHWRASLVGLLNTLLVAVMGCLLATVLGVVIGVARLSKNWILSRLMTLYVEMFRNVPVLLWIVFSMAIFIETLPKPREFKGENAQAMFFGDSVAFTNRGWYIPSPVFEAGSMIVVLTFIASIIGMIVFGRWAKARQAATGDILPTFWIKLAIFFIPTLVIFFLAGKPVTLDYPALKGFNFSGGIYLRNSLIALWLALSFYTAAFIAEIVRGGILAVSKGQTEAAYSLGLRPNRTMSLVILPQALRVIVPPLISNYLNLTKNSSLAIAVGYMDLTGTLGGITLNQTGKAMECVLLLMLCYLLISLSISAGMNWYNNSVKLRGR